MDCVINHKVVYMKQLLSKNHESYESHENNNVKSLHILKGIRRNPIPNSSMNFHKATTLLKNNPMNFRKATTLLKKYPRNLLIIVRQETLPKKDI